MGLKIRTGKDVSGMEELRIRLLKTKERFLDLRDSL
jgi:hypothetical protein